jgi:hypothetical protein
VLSELMLSPYTDRHAHRKHRIEARDVVRMEKATEELKSDGGAKQTIAVTKEKVRTQGKLAHGV